MSNKQNKVAKKKKKEKENKRKLNNRHNRPNNSGKIATYTVNGNIEKRKYLSFPLAVNSLIKNKREVELFQATILYSWDYHKIRANTQKREPLLRYQQTLKEDSMRDSPSKKYYDFIKVVKSNFDVYNFKDKEYEKEYLDKLTDFLDGNMNYVNIKGTVVDVRYGYRDHMEGIDCKNVVGSICIADVSAYDPRTKKFVHFSDHMWLFLDKLIFSTVFHFYPNTDMSIHIGDSIGVMAEIKQYSYERNNARFGVDWWALDYVEMEYIRINEKRAKVEVIPRAIPRMACVCQLNPKKNEMIYDGKTKAGIRSKVEEDIKYLRELGLKYFGEPDYLDEE